MEWILIIAAAVILIPIAIAFIAKVTEADPGDDVDRDDNSDGGFDPGIG